MEQIVIFFKSKAPSQCDSTTKGLKLGVASHHKVCLPSIQIVDVPQLKNDVFF